MLQPAIQAWIHGTYHYFLRVKKTHMSCFATTAQWCEMQTPVFSGDAWAAFHRKMLSTIPEEGLVTSDFGLDVVWCALMKDVFPSRPACLVTPGISATHLNSHAIEAYMSKDVMKQERSCTTTCRTLFNNFKSYWKNFSHHTGHCYGEKENKGIHYQGGRFTQDGDGTVRARYTYGTGINTGPSTDPPPEQTEAILAHLVDGMPKGIGVTSLHSLDKRKTLLLQALGKLCNHVPTLKVVMNMNDPEGHNGKVGRDLDASVDSRVTTTWIPGGRAVFWKAVLSPEKIGEHVDYIWFFDPSIAVHPATNALMQLYHALRTTESALVFARDWSSSTESATKDERDCIATTTNTPVLSTASTVMKAASWKMFYSGVLRRFNNGQLKQVDPGLEWILCGTLSGGRAPVPKPGMGPPKPTCIEVHRWKPYLFPGYKKDAPPPCNSAPCLEPLQRAFPSSFNSTWHEDGRCWVAGPKGLGLAKRSKNKKRGAAGAAGAVK